MKKLIFLLLSGFLLSCNGVGEEKPGENIEMVEETPVKKVKESEAAKEFDREKWLVKEGSNYPFREDMYWDLVYNGGLKELEKEEILEKLGDPDRINEGHLYYKISEKSLGLLTLSTKTLVIKLGENNKPEWVKIHG